MSNLKNLVERVRDSDSLCALLRALDWPVLEEFPFDDQPEIAQGVKGAACQVRSLIPASSDDPRLFLLVEFQEPYVRRDLREVLASLRRYTRDTAKWAGKKGTGDTIFVVASPTYEDVRFVLFEEQDRRLPRIRSFGWRHEFVGRTVLTHNLERLRWNERVHWEHAWDVDGLTETFYKDYEDTFAAVLAKVGGEPDDKTRHSWTQLLFNRLLFIAFIQRMGWLRMPGGSRDGFLFDIYRTSDRGPFKSVYGMLRAVFAELDTKEHHPYKNRYASTIGTVPYLNGGLFDQDDPLDRPDISVPNEALKLVLAEPEGLFARYNFTVTESTPLDQEVAVDPEMLGKIFERLIIAEERHKSGTYYTPRPIVEFMVNEALKGYLVERGLAADKAVLLVDQDKTKDSARGIVLDQDDLQNVADWLGQVRAVDPACGSGAYLLMLLQRLFDLTDRVQVVQGKGGRNEHAQHRLYKLKLNLLQRCVYGVDMTETAIRIARLRLWLSLVVENKGEKPEPLPNFRFLIVRGDSLASPLKPTQGVLGFPHDEVEEYTKLKGQYFHPDPGTIRPSDAMLKEKREHIAQFFKDELASSPLRSLAERPFDWEVDFAEVFDPATAAKLDRAPGFDIVLANPPYVNSGELLRSVGKAYKEELVQAYARTGSGTADLLVYFMDRAVELLRQGGQFTFITSNKWLKATYGRKLRGYIASRTHVHHLIDFRDLPVFQGTIAYPLVTIATKRQEGDKVERTTRYTSVTSLNPPYPDLPTIIQEWGGDLPPGSLGKDGSWRLAEMRERGLPLSKYLNGQRIYHGIQTSLNEVRVGPDGKQYGKGEPAPRGSTSEGVFIISGAKRAELVRQDPKSAELIHPLAIGRDIRKWVVQDNDRWMIVTPINVPINDYPAIRDHLARFKEKAEARREKGNHYWELRRCAYYGEFEKPKLVYQEIADKPGVASLPSGWYINNKAYMIPREDLYLMAVLNSNVAEQWLRKSGTSMMGGAVNMHTDMVQHLPIPQPTEAARTEIEKIVRRILKIKVADHEADVTDLEAELDRRVEFLYFGEGDSYEDALAKDVADIRALLRPKIETATLEFKETLWLDVRLGSIHGDRVLDVMKALCAMLNRDGGTILIGVNDSADIVGIERDLEKLETRDKFQRKLQEAFGVKLRPDPSDLVRVRFIPIDSKIIARVDVRPDRSTMFTLNDKVYIRRDGASVELGPADTAHWWQRRQKGED